MTKGAYYLLHVAWKVIETHGNGVRLGNMEEVVAKEKCLMRRGAVALAGASRVRRVSKLSEIGVASLRTKHQEKNGCICCPYYTIKVV